MKERPIIFSAESVRAILEDRKTQTRRVVTRKTSIVGEGKVDWSKFCWDGSQVYLDTCKHGHTEEHKAPLPFVDGRASEYYPYEHQYLHVPYNWTEDMTSFRIYPKWDIRDRLWVREAWFDNSFYPDDKENVLYRADGEFKEQIPEEYYGAKWTPSIHMFRWASRITLEITEVRVERVQEIKQSDLWREGIAKTKSVSYEEAWRTITEFKTLWDSLNAKRGYGWELNPWVWVISFRQIK